MSKPVLAHLSTRIFNTLLLLILPRKMDVILKCAGSTPRAFG